MSGIQAGGIAEVHAAAIEPATKDGKDMAGGVGMAEKPEPVVDAISDSDSDMDPEPTEEEKATLRRVGEGLPWATFLVAIVELAERFTWYGVTGPFQNYIQNPYPSNAAGIPGALGRGQSTATGLNDYFNLWAYLCPLIGAVAADQYWGRYKAIVVFSFIYLVGLIILFCTSLPVALENGAGFGGFIASTLIIGLGTGGIKGNVSPLIAEQYTRTKMAIKTLKSGERVIIDPAITVQRIYLIFYACINVGSLSSIATTEMELHIGFWSAYLLCLSMFVVAIITVIIGRPLYKVRPPTGSVLPKAFRIMWIGLMNGRNLDAAKPSVLAESGNKITPAWTDGFVEELRRALVACRVFCLYPIWWVVYSQLFSNLVSQAATMQTHKIPNDIMTNIDALTIILFVPILDRIVYPFLRRIGLPFRPISRIAMGFMMASCAMAYTAGIQHWIYTSGPCYDQVGSAACAGPNDVHVAAQTPSYFFVALAEIFANITGLEYAYTKAPSSMKSFVMAIFLGTNAVGYALAIALIPTAENPKLVWMYTGLGVATFITGIIFWFLFRGLNAKEEEMNALGADSNEAVKVKDVEKKEIP